MLSRIVPVLTAEVVTATSPAINVKYAKKVVLQLTRAAHTAGNGAFTVLGSVDGVTFVPLNILRDNAVGVLTLVASKTLSADGDALVAIDLCDSGFALTDIKVTVTRTTDGTHTVKAFILE